MERVEWFIALVNNIQFAKYARTEILRYMVYRHIKTYTHLRSTEN